MGHPGDWILSTERLIMRPYVREDADAVFKVVRRREIAETTIMIPHPYPRGTVDWWIGFVNDRMAKGTAYEFALIERVSPRYVGNCGLVAVSRERRDAELGYFIDPDLWNRGYATEACRRMLQFGFGDLGLGRIHGRCLARNTGSKRVMEKAGLRFERTARHEVLKWGVLEDIDHYAVKRVEWEELGYRTQ